MKRFADPIDPAFAEEMQVLAAFLDQQFNGAEGSPREVGFVLLSFKFADLDGDVRTNYIANADLGDVIRMLRTFLRHAEARRKAERRARLQ